jgi:hypothetical protein
MQLDEHLTTAATKLPKFTVTRMPFENQEAENNTVESNVKGRGKCKMQNNYYFLLTSIVTFLIGLIVKPDKMYERLRVHFRRQFNAGND